MRKFEIVAPNGQVSAWLLYNTGKCTGNLVINKEADPEHLSPLLRAMYDRGLGVVDERLTYVYIRERVCPPERENIMDILHNLGLTEYNPYLMTIVMEGKSFCDRDIFREVHS